MARTDPQVNVRMPESLVDQIREASERSGRSLTGEIVYRLYESFSARDLTNEKVNELTKLVQQLQSHYRDALDRSEEKTLQLESKVRALQKALDRANRQ